LWFVTHEKITVDFSRGVGRAKTSCHSLAFKCMRKSISLQNDL
jgi:hypothetical protein